MSSEGQKRYDEFINIFREANKNLTRQEQYRKGQELWNRVKGNPEQVSKEIRELKTKTAKKRGQLESYWTKTVTTPPVKKPRKEPTSETTPKSTTPKSTTTAADASKNNQNTPITIEDEGMNSILRFISKSVYDF